MLSDENKSKMLSSLEKIILVYLKIKEEKGMTADKLAKACKTSKRTIFRYISILDNLGIEIMTNGRNGYYIVEDKMKIPAYLSPSEYLSLQLLPRLWGSIETETNPFINTYQTALEKVLTKSKYDRSLMEKSKDICSKILVQQKPMTSEQAICFQTIIEALISQRAIDCEYYSMSANQETVRTLEPYFLVPREGNMYLGAYCHFRKEVRFFKVSRFKRVKLTDTNFTLDNGFNPETYMANIWGIRDDSEEISFKVRFSRNIARYVKDDNFYTDTFITDLDDGQIIFETTVRSGSEFLRWLRQFGPEAELLEPEEYRKEVLVELEKMKSLYEK